MEHSGQTDMNTEAERYPKYRWVVLGLAWVTVLFKSWSWFLIPSLAYCLIPELQLTHAQFTLIFTAPIFIAILTSIPGGALGDRYGIRLIVAIGIFLVGPIGIARAYVQGFWGMYALMCLFGVSFGFLLSNLPKIVKIWFPPKQTGLASGIYMTALGIGSALGLFTGPLFGGWKPAFIYIGMLSLVVAVFWSLFARSTPKNVTIQMPPMLSGIKRAIRSRNVCLLAVAQGLYLGGFVSFSGNFPTALEGVHLVSPKTAGAIASLLSWGIVLGHIAIPVLSDKLGVRKPLIYIGAVVSAVCFFFGWQLSPTAAAGPLILVGGFFLGGVPPLLYTLLVQLPEIGPEHVGGASGIVTSVMAAGGFLIPQAIVSPLVAGGTLSAYTAGFSIAALALATIALVTIFIMETGTGVKSERQ
jgi:nitrate/nitrite transporter NarK